MRRLRLVALVAVAGLLATTVAATPTAAVTYATGTQYVNRAISWTGWTRNQIWSGSSGPWCGRFVSKIATDVNVRPSAISRTANSANEGQVFPSGYALKRSGYSAHANSSLVPVAGDLVFIGRDSAGTISHVGIVQAGSSTRIFTVEGNPPFYSGPPNPDDVSKVTRRMYTYSSTYGTYILSGQTLNVSLSLALTPSNFPASQGTPADPATTIRVVDVITPNY